MTQVESQRTMAAAGSRSVRKIVAAIDSSAAARPVLSAANALGRLLDAQLLAVHVDEGRSAAARAAAQSAGVRLELLTGPPLEGVLQALRDPEVVAGVLGVRATPAGRRPLGHIASGIVTKLGKPVLLVPPDCRCPVKFERVLVPLEASARSGEVLRQIIEGARASGCRVVVLHVQEEDTLPAFTDQPQHEVPAWSREFLRRYSPEPESVEMEVRVGRPAEKMLAVAREMDMDVIALSWKQNLSSGRADVVRAAIERSSLPVLLVPMGPKGATQTARSVPAAEPSPLRPRF